MNTAIIDSPVRHSMSSLIENAPSFGEGTFSPEMTRIYASCRFMFGHTEEQAVRIAKQAGTDAGVIYAKNKVAITIGKRKEKDNTANIAFAAKQKNVTMTDALNIVRAITIINEVDSHIISFGNTIWRLTPILEECELVKGE